MAVVCSSIIFDVVCK